MSEQQQTTPATSPTTLEEPPPPPAADVGAEPQPAAPKKDRRVLRAVLRWTAAVVVFAAVGAGTAYGITRMERTDVPGLATEPDGRWEYPTLVKPPLPAGSPGPFAEENKAGAHYADLRALLLPAPKGAVEDKALRGTDGWLPTKTFLAEYKDGWDQEDFGQKLLDAGLRHIAARGWTTEDGTRTRIYLLQFNTAAVVESGFGDVFSYSSPAYAVREADVAVFDEDYPEAAQVSGVQRSVFVEAKPYGPVQAREAYVGAGDVMAVILQSRKGTAPAVPFQQTVTLQSQLLG
ncbi:hypothetical protein [Streptomyces griseosporeus]|uniref:hypothetical protein n=1 Tax=Streptomyces griseosporeus TaxID=1910 RepID=UPI0019BF312B|nr:hypothetical protein [Streptomyces griseosporeus]GHF80449.1 hypothetical protein GCM10018783_58620 [Streptomyces griseosporeus]